jgi:hypothetical protein
VIARVVQLAQSASPTTAVVLLVAPNLVPLIGVLAWGWNVPTILVLYWVENGIVGILNVPKMLLAAAPDTDTEGIRIAPAGVVLPKTGQVVLFLMCWSWSRPPLTSDCTSANTRPTRDAEA